MERVDAIIIGGGPAGSAAAITLGQRGNHVLLVDKATFPRDKCCGDGLTTLALRELETLGLTPSMVPNWFSVADVRLRSPSGRDVHLTLPRQGVFAATAPRAELDATLVDLAIKAGTDVRQGHRLTGVRNLPGEVQADLDGIGTVAAPVLIAADGMWSPTRKLLGLADDGYLGEWHAFRQYAAVTGEAASHLFVWFEPDLLPGYAWSFPLPGGRANIGFGVLRDGTRKIQEMGDLWPQLLKRPHILRALGDGFAPEGRHTAWPIPAAIDRATLAQRRVLFVGDAARATDVLTGEGIGQALLTGRLAAETILGGVGEPAALAARYRTAVRHHLLTDHRLSTLLNRALAHRRVANGALALVDRGDWTRRTFARWMFEDEPRAALVTPRRWHRRFLRQPGPYSENR
jgi:geranylgeranyl reductase family protein